MTSRPQVDGSLLHSAEQHNGMPVFTMNEFQDMDFFSLQVVTGRDVKPTAFANWFTGGLNYQIEHHIFPALPRREFSAN